MTRRAMTWVVLAAVWGCGDDAAPSKTPATGPRVGQWVDINGDGYADGIAIDQDGDGVADSIDLNGDGIPDALLPGVPPPSRDAGTTAPAPAGDGDGDGDADADPTPPPSTGTGNGDGDGDTDEDPPLVIDLPVASVPCGASACEIRNGNVCCDYWQRSGFGNVPMCIHEDKCLRTSPFDSGLYFQSEDPLWTGRDPKRAVVSRCDGAEDCSVGQVCCYVREGAPIPDGLSTNWIGPGAGRQCMDAKDCLAVVATNGVPTGVLSCNDDDDCRAASGTRCLPEEDNSPTTGKNVKARPDYKVCR
jgi:hypothetical protein